MDKDFNVKTVQRVSKHHRDTNKRKPDRGELYNIIKNGIIGLATHGYTQYIHPIDRELWDNEEVNFVKWKLSSDGFIVDHRSQPTSWEHFISKLFGIRYEYLVVSWSWNVSKPKRHYQWD